MKKKFLGRVLTMLLVASMVFTLLPAPAIAAGNWWWNNEAYTEEAVPTATTDNSNFMRIFHLDCGRKYFSVTEIKGIIDQLAANNYTHIELAFGNEGLRFVPDASRMTVGEYEGQAVVNAIATGNQKYDKNQSLNYTVDSWTESDMDLIFAHAAEKGIKIIPMLDIPGHMNAVIYAMLELGINVSVFSQVGTKYPGNIGQSFDTTNTAAVAFAKGLVDNYINYFAEKKCEYFNIAGDECGFGSMSAQQYDAYIGLMNELNTSIKNVGMTTMMFNDGVYYKGNNFNSYAQKLDRDIVICYWTGGGNYSDSTELAALGFKLINTNVHWYYVAGNDYGNDMFYYDYAIDSLKTKKCTECDGGGATADAGCMLAYWCDNPTAKVNTTNLNTYIKTLAVNNPDYFKTTAAPDKPGTKLDERVINVTVGGTATDTIDGSHLGPYEDIDTSIATVTGEVISGTPTPTLGEMVKLNSGEINNAEGVISDGKRNYLKVSDANITNTTNLTDATRFKVKIVSNNTATIQVVGGDYAYYLEQGTGNGLYIGSTVNNSSKWTVGSGNDFSKNRYYIAYRNGTWQNLIYDGWDYGGRLYWVYETPATATQTKLTFTGVTEGTTDVTIGNVHYTIHVTKEDLSNAPTLPIQLWITSQTIAVDQDGMKSKSTSGNFGSRKPQYLEISATDKLNTPEGRPLSECVPELIEKHYENDGTWWTTKQSGKQPFDFMLWKGTVLTGANLQGVWGESCINKGTDFAYVRYLGGKWEVSNDRSKWTTVTGTGSTSSSSNCTEQLVAYYYMQTKLTDDVTTNIVDWGDPYESQTAADYVLLDFTVKTETGEATPAISSFPMEKRTLYYHCNGNADTCGTDSNNYKYRRIDQIEARNTGEYEIYMITLTPTADSAAKKLASTCNGNAAGSGIYQGTEKVVWVKDADTLQKTEFTDETLWYTSPSGKTFDPTDTTGEYVGGKAELSNVEIYNKQGLLVTYYVRSTAVHKVYVHYIDNKTNTPFHTVEISVPTGTTYFDPNFGMASGKLINNIVAGVNHPETVQSDLQQLPLVPAQYRRANYTLTAANLGGNTTAAKDAYLYYDFSNTESFVVDFGLPLTITPKDVGNLGTATINRTKISYNGGLADISATTNGTITYKLNKPLGKTADSFSVTYTGPSLSGTETKGDVDVTFTIYIYPASNVLYEENFLTEAPASSGLGWTEGTTVAPTTPQQTQKAKANGNVFGRDTAYDTVSGPLGVWKIENLKPGQSYPCLSTTFYGNGFDLIGNCSPTTGRVLLLITDLSGKGVKAAIVDTRYNSAGENGIYQVPLAHLELEEGTYIAEVRASGLTGSGATRSAVMQASSLNADIDEFASVLAECGLTMADVEFIEMSSGTAKPANRVPSYYAASVAEAATFAPGTHVEIDGFRVYRSTTDAVAMNYYPANEQNIDYQNIIKVMANKVITAYSDNGVIQSCEISEYQKQGGPKKEIYLKQGQSISFNVQGHDNLQVSLRAVTGSAQTNVVGEPIATNTEMYYTIGKTEGLFTISNIGEGILAIGNVKLPDGAVVQTVDDLDEAAVFASVRAAFNAQPDAPDQGAFAPEIFNVGGKTTRMFRNKIVTLRVKVSADVDYVTIDNDVYRTNKWTARLFGYSTITVTKTVRSGDSHEYSVVAYNAQGQASAAKTWGY